MRYARRGDMGIELGQIVDGKYRVTARIGEGGMGAVYAGEHLKLRRRVAIKVLHASVADDPEVVSRFEREAQAAGRIGNDHILEVFDIGEVPGGDHYMVMEFLEGEPLNGRLTRLGRLSPKQIYPLAKQILEGLAAAHTAGIVHRDLKPANIFVLREKAGLPDYVKIIDFGISKFRSLAGDAKHHQTRTGTIIGTPSYMSPEQARGLREADARSDIYAVGVILYEAVTGQVPFEGASTNDLLFKIYLNEPPPIETLARDVDPGFCSIVMKALAKEPDDRFARAEDFAAALDAWMQTGQGVTVVNRGGLSPTLIERPRAASSPPDAGARAPSTQGSWAESRPGNAGLPTARSGKLILVAAVAATMILGLGALAMLATREHGDGAAAAAASASTTAAPAATPTIARLPEPIPEPPTTASPASRDRASDVDAGAVAVLPTPTVTPADPHKHPGPSQPSTTPQKPTPKRATSDPLDQL